MSGMTLPRLGAVAVGAVAMIGMIGPADAQTPKKGGSAIVVLNQDPTTLNPDLSTNVPDRILGCVIFQGLVAAAPDYSIKPLLAKSWTVSPDGLTYTFDLNKAEWHDGKPFTSADVKYSLIEVSSKFSSVFSRAGAAIDQIETPAPDKVVIKMKQTFGPFLLSLACEQGGAILPKHLFEGTVPAQNPASGAKAIGTGAFKLAEWVPGDRVRIVRFDKYFEPGKPYLDEIVGKVITVPSSRVQALQSGEIDALMRIPPNYIDTVKKDSKLKVEVADASPLMTFAFLNTTRKPLDDKRVRKALFMATDRDYLMKNVFFNVGKPGVNPFTSDMAWASNPDIDFNKMYPFDIAKANALLDEAGVKRGADGKRFSLKITVFSNNYPEFVQAAQAMRSTWAQIGVDASTEALEDATLIKKEFVDRDFDVGIQTYTSYSDPALGIARMYNAVSIGRPYGNPSGYSNPQVEDLLQKGERSPVPAERGKFYKEAQTILADDVPLIMLRQYIDNDAASAKLKGLWGVAQGTGVWSDAWIDK